MFQFLRVYPGNYQLLILKIYLYKLNTNTKIIQLQYEFLTSEETIYTLNKTNIDTQKLFSLESS